MAKTDRESDLTLNLPDHLEDAENTARLLWQNFVPDAVRRVISDDLGGTEPALALVCFLAGTHDVGKASSAFAQKLPPTATSRSSSLGLKIHAVRAPAPHGAIGQIAAREWLESAAGGGPGAYDLAEIIGGHHGRYPKRHDLNQGKDDLDTWEAPAWRPIRTEVLAAMATATGADAYLAGWVASGVPMRTKILVEAIVIMADWIASGSDLFPYADDRASSERAMDALEALAFPPPWNPSTSQGVELEDLFRVRFPHLASGSPNNLQRVVTDLVRAARAAPLMIIEAPMGAGKTEAGLLGGELLAARFGEGGLYFGLPTMATANPVFAKVSSWLSTMKAQRRASSWHMGKLRSTRTLPA